MGSSLYEPWWMTLGKNLFYHVLHIWTVVWLFMISCSIGFLIWWILRVTQWKITFNLYFVSLNYDLAWFHASSNGEVPIVVIVGTPYNWMKIHFYPLQFKKSYVCVKENIFKHSLKYSKMKFHGIYLCNFLQMLWMQNNYQGTYKYICEN